MTLVGRRTLPANNYAELGKWLDANKGKINLANAGLGVGVAPVRAAVPAKR
jgi:hypothetical protein